MPQPETPAVAFAELPVPKQVCCNTAERSTTLHLDNVCIDIYPQCGTEQLKTLVSSSAHAERLYWGRQGLHRLRLYRSAQGNRRSARMVQQQFELDPFTNTLFLFCGRHRDRIKGLYWEKDGFIFLYKRLEQGAYQWPRSESEVRSRTPQQLSCHASAAGLHRRSSCRHGRDKEASFPASCRHSPRHRHSSCKVESQQTDIRQLFKKTKKPSVFLGKTQV